MFSRDAAQRSIQSAPRTRFSTFGKLVLVTGGDTLEVSLLGSSGVLMSGSLITPGNRLSGSPAILGRRLIEGSLARPPAATARMVCANVIRYPTEHLQSRDRRRQFPGKPLPPESPARRLSRQDGSSVCDQACRRIQGGTYRRIRRGFSKF